MERKLGELSYNPKSLTPLYCGTGPNRFWDFMRSKVRQNIVNACYNDILTAEQISLETGLPLPYIDEDINALVEKQILIKEGKHYKANVIIVTADCADEMKQSAVTYHNQIADCIGKYLEEHLEEFKQIGFSGNDFSDNTLRWQLLVQILRTINQQDDGLVNEESYPQTAWGDRACLWLAEKGTEESSHLFSYSQESSRQGDWILFFDYLPNIKGDHHDFYANTRFINIFCDIAKGNYSNFGEYDLEVVADLIKKGYVRKEEDQFYVTTPILTIDQYRKLVALLDTFVKEELSGILKELDSSVEHILKEHTPRHLQSQVPAISRRDKFVQAICIPAKILVERKVLNTEWNPLEMPTTMVVVNK